MSPAGNPVGTPGRQKGDVLRNLAYTWGELPKTPVRTEQVEVQKKQVNDST